MALLLLLSLAAGLLQAARLPPPPFPGSGAADSEPSVSSSVVLDPVSKAPKIVRGWVPSAIAWANLTDRIQDSG